MSTLAERINKITSRRRVDDPLLDDPDAPIFDPAFEQFDPNVRAQDPQDLPPVDFDIIFPSDSSEPEDNRRKRSMGEEVKLILKDNPFLLGMPPAAGNFALSKVLTRHEALERTNNPELYDEHLKRIQQQSQITQQQYGGTLPGGIVPSPGAAAVMLHTPKNVEQLKAQDERVLADIINELAIEEESRPSFGGQVANVLLHMPSFVSDVALGRLAASGVGAVLKKSLTTQSKRMLKRLVNKGLLTATKSPVQTAVTLSVARSEEIATGFMDLQFNLATADDGSVSYQSSNKSPLQNLVRAYGEDFVEVFTEGLGVPIGKTFKWLGRTLTPKQVNAILKKSGKGKSVAQSFEEVTGIQGFAVENTEEFLGKGIRWLFGWDENLFPTGEELAVQMVAFAVPGAVHSGLRQIGKPTPSGLDPVTGAQPAEDTSAIPDAPQEQVGEPEATMPSVAPSLAQVARTDSEGLIPNIDDEATRTGEEQAAIKEMEEVQEGELKALAVEAVEADHEGGHRRKDTPAGLLEGYGFLDTEENRGIFQREYHRYYDELIQQDRDQEGRRAGREQVLLPPETDTVRPSRDRDDDLESILAGAPRRQDPSGRKSFPRERPRRQRAMQARPARQQGGRENIEPGVWEPPPSPKHRSIMSLMGIGAATKLDRETGEASIAENFKREGRPITREDEVTAGAQGLEGLQPVKLGELIDRYNAGERWFELDLSEKKTGRRKRALQARPEDKSREERFRELGDSQHEGEPERRMLKVQTVNGGGVLNPVVEHAGDLTHRMTEFPDDESYKSGFTFVKPKVDRIHRQLHHEYGFEKEMEQNTKNNVKHTGLTEKEFRERLDKSLAKYADAHRKLKVYNEVQLLSRELAVAIGEKRWDDARSIVDELKSHTDKGADHWAEVASRDSVTPLGQTKPEPAALNRSPHFGLPIGTTNRVDLQGRPVVARYDKDSNSIEVGPGFDSLPPARQAGVLSHEEGHHLMRLAGYDLEGDVKRLWDELPEDSSERNIINTLHPDPAAPYKEWWAVSVADVLLGRRKAVDKKLVTLIDDALAKHSPLGSQVTTGQTKPRPSRKRRMQARPVAKGEPKEQDLSISTDFSGAGTMEAVLRALFGDLTTQHVAEFDSDIVELYNEIYGTDFKPQNVLDVDPEDIRGSDLYHASPVCKSFSRLHAGKKILQSDIDAAEKIAKNIRIAKPKTVSIENVKEFADHPELMDPITEAFNDSGYNYDVQIHNAADYGAPMNRVRMIIRGVRDGELPPVPKKTKPADWFKTIKDLIPEARADTFVSRTPGEPVNDELKRIQRYVGMGKLTLDKPIITMGGSASKGVPAASNAGGTAPSLASSERAVPRLIIPDKGKTVRITKDGDVVDGTVLRVTPRMMARLMGLPDTYKVPEGTRAKERLAKIILGNGIHGKTTENFIAPLLGVAEAAKAARGFAARYIRGDDPDEDFGVKDRPQRKRRMQARPSSDPKVNKKNVAKLEKKLSKNDNDKEVFATVKANFRHMTAEEINNLTDTDARQMAEMLETMPSSNEMATVAKAGRNKRGWYDNSMRAIRIIFGDDAWQFTALLSGLSPQTSVKDNLINALEIWRGWDAAGRPKTRKGILDVADKFVQRNPENPDGGMLGAWKNNTVRALSANMPHGISGPKVQSFMENLIGNMEEVTNDAWMATWLNTDENNFQGKKKSFGSGDNKEDLGYKKGFYVALNALTRKTAKQLGFKPAEVQETVWSFAYSLYAQAEKRGDDALMEKIIADGDLLHEQVGEAPSFDQLFQVGDNAASLRKAGLLQGKEAQLDKVDTTEKLTGPVTQGLTQREKNRLLRTARRMDVRRQKRKADAVRNEVVINLASATGTIPGLNDLQKKANAGDENSRTVLSEIAMDAMKLLSKKIPSAKVEYMQTYGLYGGDLEPSLSVKLDFAERDREVMVKVLARFAKNFNQQAMHVRGDPTKIVKGKKVVDKKPVEGRQYEDGSYNTTAFTFDLENNLTRAELQDIVDKSGLIGFTVGDKTLTVYYTGDPNGKADQKEFKQSVKRAKALLGDNGRRTETRVERFWNYRRGGGPLGFDTVAGDLHPTREDVATPTAGRIASRLAQRDVTPSTQVKDDNPQTQVDLQTEIAQIYEDAPIDDTSNPDVLQAYEALATEVSEQAAAMPIKVEFWEGEGQPYKDSAAMRRDVNWHNHLYVFRTNEKTFGPEGGFNKDHPLLAETQHTDVNGTPMLVNDLLRAVHDYFAHSMSTNEFGPKGEEAAWKNHMSMTKSPWARWALTTETRGQNSWANFGKGGELNRKEKEAAKKEKREKKFIYAPQKAFLLPLEYVPVGVPDVDKSLRELPGSETLSLDETDQVDPKQKRKFQAKKKPGRPARRKRTTLKKATNSQAALAVVEEAEEAGQITGGMATLLRSLLTEVNPNFDADKLLEIADGVNQLTPDIVEEQGLPTHDEAGNPITYNARGETVHDALPGWALTAIKLYKGADADTIVEEWYHDFFFNLPENDPSKVAFTKWWNKQSQEFRDGFQDSIDEGFAQLGRDHFFATGKHKALTGKSLLSLFRRARESLYELVKRIRKFNDHNIPAEILSAFDLAVKPRRMQRPGSAGSARAFQAERKPEGRPKRKGGIKQRIRQVTGQEKDAEQAELRKKLGIEQKAAAAAFKAGKEEARAEKPEPRKTIKRTVEEGTGVVRPVGGIKEEEAKLLNDMLGVAEKASAKGFRAGELDREASVTEAIDFVKKHLPGPVHGKAISAVKKVRTPAGRKALRERVNSILKDFEHRQALNKLEKTLSRVTGKGKANKLLPEFRGKLKEMMGGLSMKSTAAQTKRRLQGLLRAAEVGDAEISDARIQGAIDRLDEAGKTPIRELTTSGIRQMQEALELLIQLNRLKKKLILGRKIRDFLGYRSEILNGLAAQKDVKLYREPSDADRDPSKGGVRDFVDSTLGPVEMAQRIMGKLEGSFKQIFYDDPKAAESEYMRVKQEAEDLLRGVAEANGLKWDGAAIEKLSRVVSGKNATIREISLKSGDTLKVTPGELIFLYNSLRDLDTQDQVLNAGVVFKDKDIMSRKVSISLEDITKINDSMTATEQAFADVMAQWMNTTGREITGEIFKVMGESRELRDDYWPRRRSKNKVPENIKIDEVGMNVIKDVTDAGILKERKGSGSPIVIDDGFLTFFHHVDTLSRAHTMAMPVRNMKMVLGDVAIKRELTRVYGKQILDYWLDRLVAISSMGTNRTGQFEQLLNKLLQGFSKSILGWNPSPRMKQFGGLFPAATELGSFGPKLIKNWAKTAGKLDKIIEELTGLSPEMRERYSVHAVHLASNLFEDTRPLFGRQKFTDKTLNGMQTSDSRIIAAIYTTALDKFDGDKEKAARETERIVSKTQNITSILDMSRFALQSKAGGVFRKGLVLFKSNAERMQNMIRQSAWEWKNSDKSAADNAKIVRTLGAVMIGNAGSSVAVSLLLRNGMRIIRGDEVDDDEKGITNRTMNFIKSLVFENLGSFYLVDTLSRIVDGAFSENFWWRTSGQGPFERVTVQAVEGAKQLSDAIDALFTGDVYQSGPRRGQSKALGEAEKGIHNLIQVVSQAVGFPMFPLRVAESAGKRIARDDVGGDDRGRRSRPSRPSNRSRPSRRPKPSRRPRPSRNRR